MNKRNTAYAAFRFPLNSIYSGNFKSPGLIHLIL